MIQILSLVLVTTFLQPILPKAFAGGGGPGCAGIVCDPHTSGIESLTRFMNVPYRGNPFILLQGAGAAFEATIGRFSRWAYRGYRGLFVPGPPAGPLEQALNQIAEEGAVFGIGTLGPIGMGRIAAAARNRFVPGLGISPAERRMLRIAHGGGGAGYREALRAWRHFRIEGKGWETYKGPMRTVYRVQGQSTERILAQSARKGHTIVGSVTEFDEFARVIGSVGREDIGRLFKLWQTDVYGRVPTVATSVEETFGQFYPAGRTTSVELGTWEMEVFQNPPGVMYTAKVPTALTLPEVQWWKGATEVPVIHEVTPGMIVSVETLPAREVIWEIYDVRSGQYLVREGQGLFAPFVP